MPELPEVENVRKSLERRLKGCRVERVTLRRKDVVRGEHRSRHLLAGAMLVGFHRHGKQLALVGHRPQTGQKMVICVHLGMSGSLSVVDRHLAKRAHTHLVWHLDDGEQLLAFRDPRRFGGVWTYPSLQTLRERRWASLGPDALKMTPSALHAVVTRSRRPLKALLLDQQRIASLGNIYVDELLFACRLAPRTPSDQLRPNQARDLVTHMRRILRRAIRAGGSSLRDYVDGEGRSGGFQNQHQVYGRAGQPCARCKTPLAEEKIIGRTTVYCPVCQGDV